MGRIDDTERERLFLYGDICLMSGGKRSLIAIEEGLKSFFGLFSSFFIPFSFGVMEKGENLIIIIDLTIFSLRCIFPITQCWI